MATRVRKDVWANGSNWSNDLLWYARGVGVLKQRALNEKTSWRYLAAMHGIDGQRWADLGYFTPADAVPTEAQQRKYWQQCQHQTWYFLPWHRAYLLSFELIVLDAVKSLNGPDDWALPYWNYSDSNNPDALKIHPAFTQQTLPGGGKNDLYVPERYGTAVAAADADLSHRIDDSDFEGIDSGTGLGVGGPSTSFSHGGIEEGLIEAAPHDLVHGDVGGRGGLMSHPNTAALDPIFWVHHANIDRLWEVWRARDPLNVNPTAAAWRNGPTDQKFAFFDAKGKSIKSKPKDVVDTVKLGYRYADISDPIPGVQRGAMRVRRLLRGAAMSPPKGKSKASKARKAAELMGAADKAVRLGANPTAVRIKFAKVPHEKVRASFNRLRTMAAGAAHEEPDRVFVSLENIRGKNGAATFDVYVKAPRAGGEHRIGSFGLFGVEQASMPSGPSGGAGLNKVLEATQAIDAMHLGGDVDLNELEVHIKPRDDVRNEDQIVVGQVSIYRK
jgi:tyrosinase